MTATDLAPVLAELSDLKRMVAELQAERTSLEWYTPEAFGRLVGRKQYTVREWCRAGRLDAVKNEAGTEWKISHKELTRYRNHGLLRPQV